MTILFSAVSLDPLQIRRKKIYIETVSPAYNLFILFTLALSLSPAHSLSFSLAVCLSLFPSHFVGILRRPSLDFSIIWFNNINWIRHGSAQIPLFISFFCRFKFRDSSYIFKFLFGNFVLLELDFFSSLVLYVWNIRTDKFSISFQMICYLIVVHIEMSQRSTSLIEFSCSTSKTEWNIRQIALNRKLSSYYMYISY